MENNKTTIIIVALIIFVIIVWYFANKKNAQKLASTSSDTMSTSGSTNTSTNTSGGGASGGNSGGGSGGGSGNTNTSTSTHSNTNTSTPTSLPPTNTNQITIKKSTPTYYQVKNVANPTYPMTYTGPVAGITFENGKVLTLLKMVQGVSGEGKLYETTEPVPSSLATSHPEISAHLFVKETDLI